jgi:hypothetical protein
MKVEVLPEDIALGVRGEEERCPVARAIQRLVLGEGLCVAVTTDSAWIGPHEADATQEKEFSFPVIVSELIEHYDITGEMDPFGFEL